MVQAEEVSLPGFQSGESSRFEELAKPKEIKDVWNFFRKLVWGNQDTIWPLSSRALMCRPTSRVLGLAKPKKLDANLPRRSIHLYSCGRSSEIWHRPPGLYSIIPSQRILHLAEPRRCAETYLKQRPRSSPQWPVSSAALCWEASPRILNLSHPRSLPSSFSFPKEVTRAALNAVASPRLIELARAKALAPGSAPDRPPEWPVSAAAKHAVASPRLGELAQPVARAATQIVQFNPEAFVVKDTAKKAYCSERVKELAKPTQR
ncbi:sperm microtubule associated protein 2-like isoform X5 [Podarcis muralis]